MPIPTPENAKLLAELMEQTALAADDNFLVSNISITKRTTFATVYNSLKNLYGVGYGIVETGSNTNGRWIKFSDGTMIQRGTATVSPTYYTDNNNIGTYGWSFYMVLYSSNLYITLPGSFVGVDDYQFIALENGGSAAQPYAQNYSANSVRFGCIVPNNATSVTFSWIAIGRWK